MSPVLLEISLILVLLTGIGVLSMAEMAIVSASRGKLQSMADAGDRGAARALWLGRFPEKFLPGARIVTTLAGICAAIFGGAGLALRLAAELHALAWLLATPIALLIVIGGLTFFSLLIGELLPQRLAARFPETIASALSRPMHLLGRFAAPTAAILERAAGVLFKMFGVSEPAAEKLSKDDFARIIRDGLATGTIGQAESRMMEGVLAFEKTDVYDIMIPRPKLTWIDVDAGHEQMWPRIVRSSQRYFPLYLNERDNLVGVVSLKDCYAQLAAGIPVSFRHLMRPPLLVPETLLASAMLEKFRETGIHVAFVIDEYGGAIGMVTLIDLMESIIGEVTSAEERRALTIQRRHDGSWLIDGMFEIEKLAQHLDDFQSPLRSADESRTMAGFFGAKLGRVPVECDRIREGGWIFEIVDMDGSRVDKVIAVKEIGGSAS